MEQNYLKKYWSRALYFFLIEILLGFLLIKFGGVLDSSEQICLFAQGVPESLQVPHKPILRVLSICCRVTDILFWSSIICALMFTKKKRTSEFFESNEYIICCILLNIGVVIYLLYLGFAYCPDLYVLELHGEYVISPHGSGAKYWQIIAAPMTLFAVAGMYFIKELKKVIRKQGQSSNEVG